MPATSASAAASHSIRAKTCVIGAPEAHRCGTGGGPFGPSEAAAGRIRELIPAGSGGPGGTSTEVAAAGWCCRSGNASTGGRGHGHHRSCTSGGPRAQQAGPSKRTFGVIREWPRETRSSSRSRPG
jgi:hypothetical protein